MGRKNLFKGLADGELPAGNFSVAEGSAAVPAAVPQLGGMGSRGAIGAVTRSIEQMKAHSIVELAPDLIEASFISDRLAGSLADHQALVASIREHGQQVPILVRPHPEREGRYQIAYGRRRLRAVTELGRPVRAVVKKLTDQQLVVAQGQENSARTDLSFIEKASFAGKLEEGGFDRETIMAALSIDKGGLSRLISVVARLPRHLIEAIGPAPKAGRNRWMELAARLEEKARAKAAYDVAGTDAFALKASDDRFTAVFNAAAPRRGAVSRPAILRADDSTRIARISQDERSLTLAVDKKATGGFAAYLVEALPEIYAAFKRREDQPETEGKDRSDP